MFQRWISAFCCSGLLALAASQSALAAINPGDIAIIGYQSDDPDKIVFVTLVAIPAGEEIRFTDDGWNAGAFRLGEGGLKWTSPVGGTPALTVVTTTAPFTDTNWVVDSTGLNTSMTPTAPSLSTSGDQVLCFQGAAATPTHIYAIGMSSGGWTSANNSNTSDLPPGLTNGTTAIDLGTAGTPTARRENAYYNGPQGFTNQVDALAKIGNPANWVKDNNIVAFPSWSFSYGGATGRCCLTSTCEVVTSAQCTTDGGAYGGDNTTCSGNPCNFPTGACCFPVGTCQIQTDANCTALAGSWQGAASVCSPNPCPQPNGYCCVASACSEITEAACLTATGTWGGAFTVCAPSPCPAPAVISGDLAFGLNSSARSGQLVRSGTNIGIWTTTGFQVQSLEFDNSNGGTHTPNGNLLGLAFGGTCTTGTEGGDLYNFSTNGSNTVQSFFSFDNAGLGGSNCSRVNGLSVSPNNGRVAVFGYDSGAVYILSYNPGTSIGAGTGASATLFHTTNSVGTPLINQGTAWLDNDHVLIATAGDFSNTDIEVKSIDATADNSFVSYESLPNAARGTTAQWFEVEYNPLVAPFIFVMQAAFDSAQNPPDGLTQSTLFVLDPSAAQGSRLIKTVILDNSMQTGREMALGPDRKLYFGESATGVVAAPKKYVDSLTLDTNGDGFVTAAEIQALSDNSTVDYYAPPSGTSANFNGHDVAIGTVPPPPLRACCIGNSCQDLNSQDCATAGGTWQGSGSTCAQGPCAPAVQACCLRNGSCQDLLPAACLAIPLPTTPGGLGPAVPQGANSTCGTTVCSAVCLRGDSNCDGAVNNFDIDFFVNGLINNQATYLSSGGTQACYDIRSCWGDVDQSALFNNFDIDPFVQCILFPPPILVSCP